MNPHSQLSPSLPCAPEEVDAFLSRPTAQVLAALKQAPGPVLVLGAGGKLGLHLSLMVHRSLAQLGRHDRVVAVSRFRTLWDREAFTRHGVDTVACDLTDEAALNALPDAPTVFYLAGLKFGTSLAPELLRKMNVEMPRLVAHRFRAARLVAFSSGNVYPFVRPESGGATEATPPAPVGEYAASCVVRELRFIEAAEKYRTAVTIIRLNYAVEFRYGVLVDIAQKVLAGDPVDVTMGYVNAIWQADAVAQSIQALDLAGVPAVPLNVTGPGVLSVRDLAHRFGDLLKRPVRITGQEEPTALLNNAANSHRLLGLPPTSVEKMTTWIAAWLSEGGTTWGKPTGFERRDGRF